MLGTTSLINADPVIRGVYSLALGQTQQEARKALAKDAHFRRIAGRFHEDFPLYEITLGDHELGVRPSFQEGHLVKLELHFRDRPSPNAVDPIIREQVRFAAETLSERFGEPDQTQITPGQIVPSTFEDTGRVFTHRWVRGDRFAEIVLRRERFAHKTVIVLAKQAAQSQQPPASSAF